MLLRLTTAWPLQRRGASAALTAAVVRRPYNHFNLSTPCHLQKKVFGTSHGATAANQGAVKVAGRSTKDILLRPALFTTAVCFGSFAADALWQYEHPPVPFRLDFSTPPNLYFDASDKNASLRYFDRNGWIYVGPKESAPQDEREMEHRDPNCVITYIYTDDLEEEEIKQKILEHTTKLEAKKKEKDNKSRPPALDPLAFVALFASSVALNLTRYISGRSWSPAMKRSFVRWFVHFRGSARISPMVLSGLYFRPSLKGGAGFVINASILSFGCLYAVFSELLGGQPRAVLATFMSVSTLTSFGSICLDLAMKRLRSVPMGVGVGSPAVATALVVTAVMNNVFFPGPSRTDENKASQWLHSRTIVKDKNNGSVVSEAMLGSWLAYEAALFLHFSGNPARHSPILAGAAIGYGIMQFGIVALVEDYHAWVKGNYGTIKKKCIGHA